VLLVVLIAFGGAGIAQVGAQGTYFTKVVGVSGRKTGAEITEFGAVKAGLYTVDHFLAGHFDALIRTIQTSGVARQARFHAGYYFLFHLTQVFGLVKQVRLSV
jgi:hypothetical protein